MGATWVQPGDHVMFIRSFARPAAVAIALAVGTSSLAASAAQPGKPDAKAHAGGAHAKEHVQFPLKSGQFEKMIELRIARARMHLNKVLAERKVPAGVAKHIKKDFDKAAETIRAAAKSADADGKVTREEARHVEAMADNMAHRA